MTLCATRRAALAAMGATLATPASVLADALAPPIGSHIPMPEGSRFNPYYAPPTKLATAIDVFRRMTAPVFLDGHGPFPFVVDTGANQSVMSQDLAARLDLPKGPQQLLHSIAGARLTDTAVVDRLRVGDVAESGAVMSVLPAAALGGPGLLGIDQLNDQRLTLDFGNQRLLFQPSLHAWRDPEDTVLPAHLRAGQLTLVNAEMLGVDVVAFLDTGAQSTVGNMALKAYAQVQVPQSYWTVSPIISVTGETIEGERAVLPSLRVGKLVINEMPVVFADLHTFRIWNLIDQPAILLGIDILSQFQTVGLDFARSEVRLHLPEREGIIAR
jgi:predicted aspartyl protease